MNKLMSGIAVGPYQFEHRVVLAPLTRMRAEDGARPGALMAEYYAQRSSPGGLLIGEATIAAENGNGYLGAPGLYDDSQIAGWKQVSTALNCMRPTATCSTSSCKTAATSALISTAAHLRTAHASCWMLPAP